MDHTLSDISNPDANAQVDEENRQLSLFENMKMEILGKPKNEENTSKII